MPVIVMIKVNGLTKSELLLPKMVMRQNLRTIKKNPDQYKGHMWGCRYVIRIALVGRSSSPDIWALQQIMGEEKVRKELKHVCKKVR